jgi:pimeloyl-ACP methyl ester carboxylesterase
MFGFDLSYPYSAWANSGASTRAEPPPRGKQVDIGGRRLRLVHTVPKGVAPLNANATPTLLFEAGAFGTAADWAVVQGAVADRYSTCAYDRAGLGYSDPGPAPRNSRAIVRDLESLLKCAGIAPPYVLVAHSMAPVHAFLFALTHPDWIKGLVLVDATPPDSMSDPVIASQVRSFAEAVSFAPMTAAWGWNMMAGPMIGDDIGLPEPARSEKARAFGSARHNRWAAAEAQLWTRDGAETREAGALSPDLPVAVITAGGGNAAFKRAQAAPAMRSKAGLYENIEAATHASLLGPRHFDAIVRGIDHVIAAAAASAPTETAS